MKPVIAIDGHVCSGKGTMARLLASHFGFAHLDSGSLYRMFAHIKLIMSGNASFSSRDSVDMLWLEASSKMSINAVLETVKAIPDEILRCDFISKGATSLSKFSEVRKVITKIIRKFAANPGENFKGSVIDGRDIGTVVIPDAICKIFMTADPMTRAKRRLEDLKAEDPDATLDEVYKSMMTRDHGDSSRKNAPLTLNDSYIVVDTTNETVEESFQRIVEIVQCAVGSK